MRAFLPTLPSKPDPSQPLHLPPPLLALLANAAAQPNVSGVAPGTTTLSSPSITAALMARVTALQQENDELYEHLKNSNVEKMETEVRVLRRAVRKLETALKGELNGKAKRISGLA